MSETKKPDRREFLRVGATSAVAAAVGCHVDTLGTGPTQDAALVAVDGGRIVDAGVLVDADPGLPRIDALPPPIDYRDIPQASLTTFPLGVASGDATRDSIILWTKYSGNAALEVAVWEPPAFGEPTRDLGRIAARPNDGSLVHVDVQGLAPGRWYEYAFVEVRASSVISRSAIARFRTAIDLHESPIIKVGATACTDESIPFDVLEAAGTRRDLDLFLLLGDTAYCDEATELPGYRAVWDRHLRIEGARKLREATSLLTTWDDHEIANDWTTLDPPPFGSILVTPERFAAARTAFFDYAPLRRPSASPDRLWRSSRWGRTLEVFCIDARSERMSDRLLPIPIPTPSARSTYLSRAQMDWLKNGLRASPCRFKLIMNSAPITEWPSLFQFYRTDRWEGFPTSRTEILSFIETEDIPGVIWVSGDFHFGSAGRVSPSGVGSSAIEILAGPGAQTPSDLAAACNTPQFDYASGDNNYTVLTFDPNAGVRVAFTASDNSVLFEKLYAI